MYELWKTVLLGVIEGVTEFLPVSSTAHLILVEHWMGLDIESPFWKLFAVFIQFGAILAVIVYFRGRIRELVVQAARSPAGRWPILAIAMGALPVLLVGYLAHRWVEQNMESPLVMAVALILGGVVMVAVELWPRRVTTERMEDMTPGQVVFIGLAQCLSVLFPGTSRAAATIVGGMAVGVSRQASTEFSFYLALPVITAAAGYSVLKHRTALDAWEGLLLALGTAVSFAVAWVVIAAFMGYVRRYTFIPFAVYRALLGGAVLLAAS